MGKIVDGSTICYMPWPSKMNLERYYNFKHNNHDEDDSTSDSSLIPRPF